LFLVRTVLLSLAGSVGSVRSVGGTGRDVFEVPSSWSRPGDGVLSVVRSAKVETREGPVLGLRGDCIEYVSRFNHLASTIDCLRYTFPDLGLILLLTFLLNPLNRWVKGLSLLSSILVAAVGIFVLLRLRSRCYQR
jgi:hypothetical protein